MRNDFSWCWISNLRNGNGCMITQPEKLQRTPLKEDIEDAFKSTQRKATILRNMVNCKCPGNKDVLFREFVGHFDYLFHLSKYKKEVNKDIVHKISRWFDIKKTAMHAKNGLDLFEEYSNELFDKSLIKY